MEFKKFIEIECKNQEFKKEWDRLHEINSISEALEILSKLNEGEDSAVAVLPDPESPVDKLLKNKGIKATQVIPNTIIFYEVDSKCPVYEFINEIKDQKLKAKVANDIEQLSIEGFKLKKPKAAHVRDGIFELRTIQSNNITRIFYFFVAGSSIILTNGYIKKQQKVDEKELKRAKKYRDEYLNRNQ